MSGENKGSICVLRHGYYPQDPRVYKEVRALCDAGYSVDVICLRKPGEKHKEEVDNVKVYRLRHFQRSKSLGRYLFDYGLSFLLMGVKVTFEYFKKRYSCIQVNTMPDALVFTTLIPRLFGAKVLLDMHEPIPELWITKYGERRLRVLLRLQEIIEQLAIHYASKVITVNEKVRERFIERGADGSKIAVVRNVPDDIFTAKVQSKPLSNEFVLLTHGTIEPRYGHEVILRALPSLRDKIAGLRVYIIGDGQGTHQLHRLSRELGCSDLITFTGTIPFQEVGEFISRADVGLVPLLHTPFGELCQPNKMFEYVALRKPVVVSRLQAIEEIFDESCVMFTKPGNPEDLARCILDIYHHPDKAKNLAENAYRRYSKLRWCETKNTYLKIVDHLVIGNKT